MSKRILDFDYQLGRLFGELIYDYDNIESANGLYDIIFLHREGLQDNFKDVKKYTKSNSKIICDITTESGNIDPYLDTLSEISSKESFDFHLIVDTDISDYLKKNNPNFKCLSGYDLGIYAFTNHYSDGKTFVSNVTEKNTNAFLSYNGSMRTNRVLFLLELVKRKIMRLHITTNPQHSYASSNIVSFLFYQSNKEFNRKEYVEFLDGMLNDNNPPKYIFTHKDWHTLKYETPLPIFTDFQHPDHIPNEIDGSYEPIINVVTENTHGFERDDDLSKYDITTFTEKTLKPFLARQIPLFIGPPKLERELRKLGFDLFDDIVDYSFESIDSNYRRLHKKIDELERLLTIDLVSYKKENIERFNKNRMLVNRLSNSGFTKIDNFVIDNIYDKK